MAIATVNPTSGKTEMLIEPHDAAEVDARFTEAAAAALALQATTFAQRATCMRAAADILDDQALGLGELLTVEVGKPPAVRAAWLGTDLPTLMKAGAAYTATLRVRNDGTEIWRKARGAAIGYRWRRLKPFRAADGPQADEPVSAKMTAIPLPADVPPGIA